MAKQFDQIEAEHQSFIEAQHIFFAGSAAPEGRVNISPKGMDSLRVLGPNRIVWMNFTGSGNETAGHLRLANRLTLMWCSFTTQPRILRAYGKARTVHHRDTDWAKLSALFDDRAAARQIYDMSVEMVQTSCGYAVPFMEYQGERDTLETVNGRLGKDGARDYWRAKNMKTIDGLPTGVLEDDE